MTLLACTSVGWAGRLVVAGAGAVALHLPRECMHSRGPPSVGCWPESVGWPREGSPAGLGAGLAWEEVGRTCSNQRSRSNRTLSTASLTSASAAVLALSLCKSKGHHRQQRQLHYQLQKGFV